MIDEVIFKKVWIKPNLIILDILTATGNDEYNDSDGGITNGTPS
jgi:hypothetical protein